MKQKVLLVWLSASFSILFSINNCYSQNVENISKTSSIKRVSENSNYQPSGNFSQKVLNFSEQVYLNCPQYRTTELMAIYEAQIERVQVIEATSEQTTNYPLLSTIPLKNKCNPSLTYDHSSFDVADFNPLKYFFNYNASEDLYYRIDNSNYVVKVSSNK